LVEKNASDVTGTVNATRIKRYNPATTQAHRFISLLFSRRTDIGPPIIQFAWFSKIFQAFALQ
jgi:hypothetical protein